MRPGPGESACLLARKKKTKTKSKTSAKTGLSERETGSICAKKHIVQGHPGFPNASSQCTVAECARAPTNFAGEINRVEMSGFLWVATIGWGPYACTPVFGVMVSARLDLNNLYRTRRQTVRERNREGETFYTFYPFGGNELKKGIAQADFSK